MKKINRKSAGPPHLRRPAPAPYFHPLFLIFQCSAPLGKVIKTYFPWLWKKGGGGSGLCTCIITTAIVMCIMHCRKYHRHDCNRDSHLHNFNNCHPCICCRNVAETSNSIIATETVTSITATKTSTNISVAESNANIIAIESQNLHNCSRCWPLHNCYRKCQLHSSNRITCTTCIIDYRNFHLQKWWLSEIVLVTIKKLSEWVKIKFKAK